MPTMPTLPPDPVPSPGRIIRVPVGADPSQIIHDGLRRSPDPAEGFLFEGQSYDWTNRVYLPSSHDTKLLVLYGGGATINTLNSSGYGFFSGGDGWTIIIRGCQFKGEETEGSALCDFRNFATFRAFDSRWELSGNTGLFLYGSTADAEVGIYHCLFDQNSVHGLEMLRIGPLQLRKVIAQRNNYYGIYCRENRAPGIIRGSHLEQNGISSGGDWGLNISSGNQIKVESTNLADCRMWVDDVSCSVRYTTTQTKVGSTAGYALYGGQPSDNAVICGYATKSKNYDVADIHDSITKTC